MNPVQNNKLGQLESLRGLAAFIVFIGHFMLAFAPQRHGYLPGAVEGGSLMGTPMFLIVNGSASVALFFVLSGFVLSYGYFKDHKKSIVGATLKRWPRLFPIALLSTLLSYTCIKLSLYQHLEAIAITHSDWMKHFAYAGRDNIYNVSFFEAFTQGAFLSFFRGNGDAWLNSSLWTMHIELIGSFIVFGTVSVVRTANITEAILVFLIVGVLAYFGNAYFSLFVAGSCLAYCYHSGIIVSPKLGRLHTTVVAVFLIFLFGYMNPANGIYKHLNPFPALENDFRISLHGFASLVLIYLSLGDNWLKNALSNRRLQFLGHVSFPIYALHVPLMFSFSASIFLVTFTYYGYKFAVILTFISTTALLLFAGAVIGDLDNRWCNLLARPRLNIKSRLSHKRL